MTDRRVTLTNAQGRARIARLRRRLSHLQERIRDGHAGSFDHGEASALEWAIGQLERFARVYGALRALRETATPPRRLRRLPRFTAGSTAGKPNPTGGSH